MPEAEDRVRAAIVAGSQGSPPNKDAATWTESLHQACSAALADTQAEVEKNHVTRRADLCKVLYLSWYIRFQVMRPYSLPQRKQRSMKMPLLPRSKRELRQLDSGV